MYNTLTSTAALQTTGDQSLGIMGQYLRKLALRFGAEQARQALLNLDDRMLDDIGLTRRAVELMNFDMMTLGAMPR